MNNFFRADLHSHSTFSDGSDTPEELIDKAIALNLNGLSITDHDTFEAYTRAIPYAKARNFPLLPGIEFSTTFRNESIHILCYAFPLENKEIASLCERHHIRRLKRNKAILDKLRRFGILITEEEITPSLPNSVVGRPHIALALIKKGVVTTLREAFQKYLGEGKKAYVPGEVISTEETIRCIKKAGGIAILAHPALITRKRILKGLLELPFDGLEGYYANLPAHQEEPLITKAKEKGWMVTGGSDYHGSIKNHISLGCSWVNEETFQLLYGHFLKCL